MGYCITVLIIDPEAAKHQRMNYGRVSVSSCRWQELTAPLQRGHSRRQDSSPRAGHEMLARDGGHARGEGLRASKPSRRGRRGGCPAEHRPPPVAEGTTAWWAAPGRSVFWKENRQDPRRSHHIPLPQLPTSRDGKTALDLLGYGPLRSKSKTFLSTWLLPVRSYIK